MPRPGYTLLWISMPSQHLDTTMFRARRVFKPLRIPQELYDTAMMHIRIARSTYMALIPKHHLWMHGVTRICEGHELWDRCWQCAFPLSEAQASSKGNAH
eukprot:833933-Alexandrium_andersonii.AAC.1